MLLEITGWVVACPDNGMDWRLVRWVDLGLVLGRRTQIDICSGDHRINLAKAWQSQGGLVMISGTSWPVSGGPKIEIAWRLGLDQGLLPTWEIRLAGLGYFKLAQSGTKPHLASNHTSLQDVCHCSTTTVVAWPSTQASSLAPGFCIALFGAMPNRESAQFVRQ
jgi:hypothetical protein